MPVDDRTIIELIQEYHKEELLLGHVFNELGLNKVVIQCVAENMRSRSIPQRLGFKEEGISREGQWLYDHYVDLVNYSLLRREWLHTT